jgi:hypothetical protein
VGRRTFEVISRAGRGSMPGMQTPAKKASLRLVGNNASTLSGKRCWSPLGDAWTSATGGRWNALPAELADHPDYEIVRELGHGGMGVVFRAHIRIMGLDEVLKVIGPDIVERPVGPISDPGSSALSMKSVRLRCGTTQNLPEKQSDCDEQDAGSSKVRKNPDPAALSIAWRAALGVLVATTSMRPFISLSCSQRGDGMRPIAKSEPVSIFLRAPPNSRSFLGLFPAGRCQQHE